MWGDSGNVQTALLLFPPCWVSGDPWYPKAKLDRVFPPVCLSQRIVFSFISCNAWFRELIVSLSLVKPVNIIVNFWFSIAADFLCLFVKFSYQIWLILFSYTDIESLGWRWSISPEFCSGISTKPDILSGDHRRAQWVFTSVLRCLELWLYKFSSAPVSLSVVRMLESFKMLQLRQHL